MSGSGDMALLAVDMYQRSPDSAHAGASSSVRSLDDNQDQCQPEYERPNSQGSEIYSWVVPLLAGMLHNAALDMDGGRQWLAVGAAAI